MTRPLARLLALTAALCLGLTACGIPGERRAHRVVGPDAEPLETAFNADVDRPRMLMLVGPTCGICLRNAADLQDRVLADNDDPRLRGYVVWVPTLGATERDVPGATPTVPDPRAEHFWNPGGELMRAYATVLGLDPPAWDVYFGYRPGVRWEGELPPRPDFWMQEGGDEKAPDLDAAVFATRLGELAPEGSR